MFGGAQQAGRADGGGDATVRGRPGGVQRRSRQKVIEIIDGVSEWHGIPVIVK
jgi:hypothetical protein